MNGSSRDTCNGTKTFQEGSNRATLNKLMMTVYQVVLQHPGPIHKFILSLKALESCPEIDQLINFVSKNGIKELTLHIYKGEPYKLPSSLFSCQDITHLELFSCVVKPPPAFKGFSRLLCLQLMEVDIAGDAISSLISTCPLLERLSIRSSSFDDLEIVALNLRFVRLAGSFSSICFKNTPHLAKVSMHLASSFQNLVSERETSGPVMLIGSFPEIELLELDCYHLKAMAGGGVLIGHPYSLTHLKAFPGEMIALDYVPQPLEVQGWSDISLNELREVEVHRVFGTRPELDFMKVLLAKSPILERLLIKLESEEVSEESRLLEELMRFKRLSPEAEITFRKQDADLRFGDGFE
ncbi:hypothetical protein Vadar_032150 [Vaccinium darrowii]|uniref:Uncharacterized protein n=1 Tax=Vaccinium darrowii TaxID=229202 RepID=A0ACB7X5Q5_9ERIC|nr:hypothetical protein Vadar_032150 [Vaccinium darrowii]